MVIQSPDTSLEISIDPNAKVKPNQLPFPSVLHVSYIPYRSVTPGNTARLSGAPPTHPSEGGESKLTAHWVLVTMYHSRSLSAAEVHPSHH